MQAIAQILKQSRLTARRRAHERSNWSGARKLAQDRLLNGPEPNIVRRWSREHSRGRDQLMRFSHQPFSLLFSNGYRGLVNVLITADVKSMSSGMLCKRLDCRRFLLRKGLAAARAS
jgi:hypothetical protein